MHAGQAAASATFDGTLLVTTPSGEQLEVGATFDTGSDTDAVSVKTATKLIDQLAKGSPMQSPGNPTLLSPKVD